MNDWPLCSTDKPPKKRCEFCKHYRFYDSAYGRCYRYPPVLMKRLKWNRFWFKIYFEERYPFVAWMELSCGEYDERKGIKDKDR